MTVVPPLTMTSMTSAIAGHVVTDHDTSLEESGAHASHRQLEIPDADIPAVPVGRLGDRARDRDGDVALGVERDPGAAGQLEPERAAASLADLQRGRGTAEVHRRRWLAGEVAVAEHVVCALDDLQVRDRR